MKVFSFVTVVSAGLIACLAAPVQAIEKECGAHPDPHFYTFDGTYYDYQGTCDTVFVHAPALNLDVHLRTVAQPGYSLITAVGLKVGGDVKIITTTTGSISSTTLGLNPLTYDTVNKVYQLTLPNGQWVRVTAGYGSLSIVVHGDSSQFSTAVGMCGTWATPGMIKRDGSLMPGGPNAGTAFGEHWKVVAPGDPTILTGGNTCSPPVAFSTANPAGCLCVDANGIPVPDPNHQGCDAAGGTCDKANCLKQDGATGPAGGPVGCLTKDQIQAACANIVDPNERANCEFDLQVSGDPRYATAPFYSGVPITPLPDTRCKGSDYCAAAGGKCVFQCKEDEGFLCDTTLCNGAGRLAPPVPSKCACKIPRDTCPVDPAAADAIAIDIANPPGIPVVKPVDPTKACMNFDNGSNEGFGPCPGVYSQVAVTPFPANAPADPSPFIHLTDLPGGSLACGTGAAYTGSWDFVCKDGCYEMCFDFKVFYDGCTSTNPACKLLNSLGQAYMAITPRIIFQGGAPNYYRALLTANFTVTDAKGPNPGWHTVCGMLGPLDSSGNMPTGANGTWSLLPAPCNVLSGALCTAGPIPTPQQAWCPLWSNMAAIELPIDVSANPAEQFGYDHLCVQKIENCGMVCNPEPLCYWKNDVGCKSMKKQLNLTLVANLKELKYWDLNHTCFCDILDNCCPDRCDIAEQEYLALLANYASGLIDLNCGVDFCGGCDKTTTKTVLQIMQQIDAVLSRRPRSEFDCSKAMALAAGINEGQLLCPRKSVTGLTDTGVVVAQPADAVVVSKTP